MRHRQIKRVKIILFLLVFCGLLIPLNVLGKDFGNHNKKFTPPNKMKSSDWSDPKELERVWNASLVRIPIDNRDYISAYMQNVHNKNIPNKRFPTVIYMHGCSGIWSGTYTRLNFLAREGFAVIAPQSFARSKYPQSCDPVNFKGGMYRGTLKMRQMDAENAISKAKKLLWVDADNIFLMGLSQGGVTTATYLSSNPSTAVKARIIEGWTCHAGWHEYKGLNSVKHEPVLALVGKDDPWFQVSWLRGECGAYMNKKNGSKSVVFQQTPLSRRHELLEDSSVQEIVVNFLNSQMY